MIGTDLIQTDTTAHKQMTVFETLKKLTKYLNVSNAKMHSPLVLHSIQDGKSKSLKIKFLAFKAGTENSGI